MALAILLCCQGQVLAAAIILTADSSAPAIAEFTEQLQHLRPQDSVRFMPLVELKQQPEDSLYTLVTFDQASIAWRNQLADGPPTIALRFNLEAVQRLKQQALAPGISFLLSDPPLERQLTLAKLLQPHIRRIGLLHPADFSVSAPLNARATALNIALNAQPWPNPRDRRPLLNVLEDNDVLLGLDSERLYNAATIKNILLTSYGHSKALIGPTQSYVEAGSLASTYCDTQDWLLSLNALLNRPAATWPITQYPPFFKVRINKQVARALGIELPDTQQLQKRLAAWEQQP